MLRAGVEAAVLVVLTGVEAAVVEVFAGDDPGEPADRTGFACSWVSGGRVSTERVNVGRTGGNNAVLDGVG